MHKISEEVNMFFLVQKKRRSDTVIYLKKHTFWIYYKIILKYKLEHTFKLYYSCS